MVLGGAGRFVIVQKSSVGDVVGVMQAGNPEQWAAPHWLYHRACCRFGAGFIGHGVFAPGVLIQRHHEFIFNRIGGTDVDELCGGWVGTERGRDYWAGDLPDQEEVKATRCSLSGIKKSCIEWRLAWIRKISAQLLSVPRSVKISARSLRRMAPHDQ